MLHGSQCSRVLHAHLLRGWTERSWAGFFWWRSYAGWGDLPWKQQKKLSLRDVKGRDNIWNIWFVSVNTGFPPCSVLQSPYKKQGHFFPQILVFLSTSWNTFYMRMEIWAGKLYLLYMTSPSISNWPVVKFPQRFLENLYFPSDFHDQ